MSSSTIDNLLELAKNSYHQHFNEVAAVCAIAPGRVNLIGEHTDYNKGYVLPMAMPLVTILVGCPTETGVCKLLTLSPDADQPYETEFNLPSESVPLAPGSPSWANYVKGVVACYKGKLKSFNAFIASSVPLGGGLSSSAALEVATYTFLDCISPDSGSFGMKDKALACQKAEHEYGGMPCGIMDQFISFMAVDGHALLIDCRSMECQSVPWKDPSIALLVTNCNVKHKLTGSEYPTRRRQCEEAARVLQKDSLRDATLEELEAIKDSISPEVYKRAKHVITEIQRTVNAVSFLERGDYKAFGSLMFASHHSLRHDYEVSCSELDQLVEIVTGVDGVHGSRMTGAGFGGCTVTLVQRKCLEIVKKLIKDKYTGSPTFYVALPSQGARSIDLTS